MCVALVAAGQIQQAAVLRDLCAVPSTHVADDHRQAGAVAGCAGGRAGKVLMLRGSAEPGARHPDGKPWTVRQPGTGGTIVDRAGAAVAEAPRMS